MSKRIRIADLPNFDPANRLKCETDIAAHLSLVIDEGDPGELVRALGVAVRARGRDRIA